MRQLLLRNIRRYSDGDPRPLQRTLAKDVHFVFPGESSWSADVHGREEVERWQQRFLAAGLRFVPQEILVDGPPWRTRIAVRFSDHLDAPGGERVYANAGVIFGEIAWGRVVSYTVYEDTQKLTGLDEHLAAAERGGTP